MFAFLKGGTRGIYPGYQPNRLVNSDTLRCLSESCRFALILSIHIVLLVSFPSLLFIGIYIRLLHRLMQIHCTWCVARLVLVPCGFLLLLGVPYLWNLHLFSGPFFLKFSNGYPIAVTANVDMVVTYVL